MDDAKLNHDCLGRRHNTRGYDGVPERNPRVVRNRFASRHDKLIRQGDTLTSKTSGYIQRKVRENREKPHK